MIYEEGRGWYTTEPFSEIETFDFPDGIGPVECVNVEHEEVVLIPQKVKAKQVRFKYGLGAQFIETLKTIHTLGLDKKEKVKVEKVKNYLSERFGTLQKAKRKRKREQKKAELKTPKEQKKQLTKEIRTVISALKRLLRSGQITEKQFEQQKASLMGLKQK